MDTQTLKYIGKDLYKTHILKEWKRYIVFMTRCHLHKGQINDLLDFFKATPQRQAMLEHTTSFVEQTTRAFFYKDSTWDERIAIVKNHIEYMENIFNDEAIAKLYVNGERIRLWEDVYEEQPVVMELWFHGGQRKEGCLSLDGVRPCTRYKEIEVDYLDTNFKKQHGKYIGWTAQIIQHEVDHCNGIVI